MTKIGTTKLEQMKIDVVHGLDALRDRATDAERAVEAGTAELATEVVTGVERAAQDFDASMRADADRASELAQRIDVQLREDLGNLRLEVLRDLDEALGRAHARVRLELANRSEPGQG